MLISSNDVQYHPKCVSHLMMCVSHLNYYIMNNQNILVNKTE